MKEIVSEYGNAILAAVAVIGIIALSYGLFQGQLHDAVVQYDESLYGSLTNINGIGGLA